jgi:hypothetical protein
LAFHIKGKSTLKVHENRALKRMPGPKKEKETSDWKKVYTPNYHDFTLHKNIV